MQSKIQRILCDNFHTNIFSHFSDDRWIHRCQWRRKRADENVESTYHETWVSTQWKKKKMICKTLPWENTNMNTNVLFSRPEPLLKGCDHITITYHAMTLNNAAIHTHTVLIQEWSVITFLLLQGNDTPPFKCFIQIHTKVSRDVFILRS